MQSVVGGIYEINRYNLINRGVLTGAHMNAS